jgi:arginase family enzyme
MTQVRGFLDFDLVAGDVLPSAPVLLLGVPVEGGCRRAGCSAAPDAIRRASAELISEHAGQGVDLGNLTADKNWREPVREFVELSIGQGSIPVLLGGGPKVADIALEAAGMVPIVAATHVLWPGFTGRHVVWLGLNGPQSAPLWDDMMEGSQSFLTAQQLDAGATADFPDRAFFWIDAAVIDTGHAAGASDINPGGLAPAALLKAIAPLKGRIRGIVVTGATPDRDPRGLTELVLASAIRDVLGNG